MPTHEPEDRALDKVLRLHSELTTDGHDQRDISSSFLSIVVMDLIKSGVTEQEALDYLTSSIRDCYLAITKGEH